MKEADEPEPDGTIENRCIAGRALPLRRQCKSAISDILSNTDFVLLTPPSKLICFQ